MATNGVDDLLVVHVFHGGSGGDAGDDDGLIRYTYRLRSRNLIDYVGLRVVSVVSLSLELSSVQKKGTLIESVDLLLLIQSFGFLKKISCVLLMCARVYKTSNRRITNPVSMNIRLLNRKQKSQMRHN